MQDFNRLLVARALEFTFEERKEKFEAKTKDQAKQKRVCSYCCTEDDPGSLTRVFSCQHMCHRLCMDAFEKVQQVFDPDYAFTCVNCGSY